MNKWLSNWLFGGHVRDSLKKNRDRSLYKSKCFVQYRHALNVDTVTGVVHAPKYKHCVGVFYFDNTNHWWMIVIRNTLHVKNKNGKKLFNLQNHTAKFPILIQLAFQHNLCISESRRYTAFGNKSNKASKTIILV